MEISTAGTIAPAAPTIAGATDSVMPVAAIEPTPVSSCINEEAILAAKLIADVSIVVISTTSTALPQFPDSAVLAALLVSLDDLILVISP